MPPPPPLPRLPAGPPPRPKAPSAPPREMSEQEKKLAKAEKRRKTRKRVAHEIMTTEETYVGQLNQVVDLYIMPLTMLAGDKERQVLNAEETRLLFSNLQMIAALNSNFLKDLRTRLEDYDPDTSLMSDLFIDFHHYFKMYTQYVGNHDNATAFLTELNKSNSKWQSFQTRVLQDERHKGQGLASYFITPIQRIPRYKLLLDELRKQSPDTHPDYAGLKEASDIVGKVAGHINNAMHVASARRKLLDIQSNFQGNVELVDASRQLIKSGPLVKKCRRDDRKYEFFLFTDILLYASLTTTGKYKLHQRLSVNQFFIVNDVPDDEGNDKVQKNRMEILSEQKSFIVFATSSSDKIAWLTAFVKCTEDAKKRIGVDATRKTHVAPVWQRDSDSDKCNTCGGGFSLFNRRHHCRHCGGLVCGSCSKKRMRIQKPGETTTGKEQRVCDTCVDNITNKRKPKAANASSAEEQAALAAAASKIDEEIKIAAASQPDHNDDESDDEDEGGQVVTQEDIRRMSQAPPPVSFIGKAKAIAAYTAGTPTDLSFQQGEFIDIIEKADSGWWLGDINGRRGEFPRTYIVEVSAMEIKQSRALPPPPEASAAEDKVVCTMAYSAESDDPAVEYLSYQVGDVLNVADKDVDWWFGTNSRDGTQGWFSPADVKPYVAPAPKPVAPAAPKPVAPKPPAPKPVAPKPPAPVPEKKVAAPVAAAAPVGVHPPGEGKCSDCSCGEFRPNMFKKSQCMDCRHNISNHTQ